MMVESSPTSALKMTKADLLFEFLVVAFNVRLLRNTSKINQEPRHFLLYFVD